MKLERLYRNWGSKRGFEKIRGVSSVIYKKLECFSISIKTMSSKKEEKRVINIG